MRRPSRVSCAVAILLAGWTAAGTPCRARAASAAGDEREAKARALVVEGRTRFAEGSFGQRRIAIRLFEEAAQLEPTDPTTLSALGRGYLDAGFNHLACVTYEKLTRRAPESPDGWYGLALLYKRNWLRSLADEDLDRAIGNAEATLRVEPTHCDASVLLAVLRVERGLVRDAGRLVERALARGCDSPDLLLAGVHLAYRSGDAALAESLLAAVRPRLPAAASARFDDIGPMLGEFETERFAAMSASERGAYAKRFWMLSDPDPTTDLNEAIVEYHARVAHAMLMLSDSWNPRWDMRAALYVRYGAPKHVSFLPVGVPDMYRLNKAQIFVTTPDGSIHEITNGMYLPKNVQAWEYPQLGFIVMLEDKILSWNYEMPRVDEPVFEPLASESAAEANGLVGAADGRAVFSPLLPDVRRLRVDERVSRLQTTSGGLLLAQLEVPGTPGDSLRAEAVVLDSAGARVARGEAHLSPSRCDPAGTRTADFTFDVPPGEYKVALAVSDNHGGRGVSRTRSSVDPDAGTLALSDVVPVCGAYEAGSQGAPVRLAPNVNAYVEDGAAFNAYYEIYHLRAGEDGLAQFEYTYEVHSIGRDSRPWYERLMSPGDHARIAVHSTESSPAPLRRQFIRVPVGGLRPGRYRLDVIVKDLLAGTRTVRSLEFYK
jgi:GWxTD domain-containing protein